MDPEEQAPPSAMGQFRRWGAIAVALAAVGYLCYAVWKGFSETAAELSAFAWVYYIPILALTLVNYGLRYAKWHFLLGRLGVRISHAANSRIFLTGLAMVISPAKAGEVVKPYLVREVTGTPMARTIPALVAERTTDGIAVVVLAAIGVSTFYAEAAQLIWGTLAGIGLVLVVLSVRPLAVGTIDLIGKVPGLSGVASKLHDAYDATRTCLAPFPLFVTVLMSLVAWGAECVGYWLVFLGLSAEAPLDACTFLYAFATVFGAPSPGGMGMADAALTEGAIAMLGVDPPAALAASLLVRVATLWFGVLLGAGALISIDSLISKPSPQA